MGLPKTGYFDKVLETRRKEKSGKQKEKIVARQTFFIHQDRNGPSSSLEGEEEGKIHARRNGRI